MERGRDKTECQEKGRKEGFQRCEKASERHSQLSFSIHARKCFFSFVNQTAGHKHNSSRQKQFKTEDIKFWSPTLCQLQNGSMQLCR